MSQLYKGKQKHLIVLGFATADDWVHNYTKLAIKEYIGDSKSISAQKLPPMRIEPGDLIYYTLVPFQLIYLGTVC